MSLINEQLNSIVIGKLGNGYPGHPEEGVPDLESILTYKIAGAVVTF
jgi:hypothetical protein